jgi:hypothetical protein
MLHAALLLLFIGSANGVPLNTDGQAESALIPIAVGSTQSVSAVVAAAHLCGYFAVRSIQLDQTQSKLFFGSVNPDGLDCTKAWMRQHKRELGLSRAQDAPNATR